MCLEPYQTPMTERFHEIVNGWKPLTIFAKGSFIDVWQVCRMEQYSNKVLFYKTDRWMRRMSVSTLIFISELYVEFYSNNNFWRNKTVSKARDILLKYKSAPSNPLLVVVTYLVTLGRLNGRLLSPNLNSCISVWKYDLISVQRCMKGRINQLWFLAVNYFHKKARL